jgi:hypothetical protein
VRGWRDTMPIKEAEVHFTCVVRGERRRYGKLE